jgi:hypothetical protein
MLLFYSGKRKTRLGWDSDGFEVGEVRRCFTRSLATCGYGMATCYYRVMGFQASRDAAVWA